MHRVMMILLAVFCLTSVHEVNAAHDLTKDAPGSRDIPGLPRYEGSVIIGYELGKFDESELPMGKWVDRQGGGGWEKSVNLEGRRTRILYLAPKDRSSLEVMRNYQNGLKKLGYEVLFECAGSKECGERVEAFYTADAAGKKLKGNQMQEYAFSEYSVKDPRLVVARRTQDNGESHIFVFSAHQDNYAETQAGGRVAVFVEEVLSAKMEDKMVTLKAEEMEKHLDAHGKAAIYGIYFDFDKAVVKPESRAQLEQMAGFLKARADVKVFIVGHTDNKGSFDYNLKLSQQRAEAVVAALVKDFGIAPERLSAKGVAGLAPVTSNSTEAGCAKNRRVEMVLR